MTDDVLTRSPAADARPTPASLLAATLCVLPMSFVIIVVNYWIYRARADFIRLHPDYYAVEPPTISRAISDPAIGEPFAFWIAISAALLVVGVLPVCWLYFRSGLALPASSVRARRVLLTLPALAFVCQCAAAVGMVMLSSYRFPDFHDEHMLGSYVFFAGQAVVVMLAGFMCTAIARDPAAARALRDGAYIDPRVSRFRGPAAFAGVGLALAYLGLFALKEVELPVLGTAIYWTYVLAEPTLISYFLAVLATYVWDVFRAVSGIRTASRRPFAAS